MPAADEDTTKAFYIEKLGFHLDYDRPNDQIRAGIWWAYPDGRTHR